MQAQGEWVLGDKGWRPRELPINQVGTQMAKGLELKKRVRIVNTGHNIPNLKIPNPNALQAKVF